MLVGLSSIHWREAWKYGERAFRYCHLDIGHALGAFRYAAGALGWSARVLDAAGSAEIMAVLGLDRTEDFAGVELEDPELLIAIESRKSMRPDFEWQTPEGTPAHLPLFRLLPADCRSIAKMVSCHQAIASDGCFALSMLADFQPLVEPNPWRYRQLHWEAGLLGHVLYLEAEAAGLHGTGIGCFYDDALHSLLGLEGLQLQTLYHFTVGRPFTDNRITTSPAYPDREERRLKEQRS